VPIDLLAIWESGLIGSGAGLFHESGSRLISDKNIGINITKVKISDFCKKLYIYKIFMKDIEAPGNTSNPTQTTSTLENMKFPPLIFCEGSHFGFPLAKVEDSPFSICIQLVGGGGGGGRTQFTQIRIYSLD
jgi:hypothetical protein